MLFENLCFLDVSHFLLAEVRSWKPVMPRSISGLVMQNSLLVMMRVANVGGGLSGGGDF